MAEAPGVWATGRRWSPRRRRRASHRPAAATFRRREASRRGPLCLTDRRCSRVRGRVPGLWTRGSRRRERHRCRPVLRRAL